MGGWRIAQSPILVTTITLERLRKRGYESLLSYYEKVALHLNVPIAIVDAVYATRTHGGVRGAPVG